LYLSKPKLFNACSISPNAACNPCM
jgi:hypothetical protein